MLAGMLDVTGILRRVRRLAGLSQSGLAAALGVSQSRIARAEASGDAAVSLLQAVLSHAGMQLVVIDADGHPVEPMSPNGCRDDRGDRLPPYVDPVAADPWNWRLEHARPYSRPVPRFTFRFRENIDPLGDHPNNSRTHEALRQERLARERAEQHRAWLARLSTSGHEDETEDWCRCGPECERECVASCDCQCEPIGCRTRLVGHDAHHES